MENTKQIQKILNSLTLLYLLNRDSHNIIVEYENHLFVLGEIFGFHIDKELEDISYYGITENKDYYDFEGHTCHFLTVKGTRWELMENSTCFDSFWIEEISRVSKEMLILKRNEYKYSKDNKFAYIEINNENTNKTILN